jgi:hypothetical protein
MNSRDVLHRMHAPAYQILGEKIFRENFIKRHTTYREDDLQQL